jgi:hypothetical protein
VDVSDRGVGAGLRRLLLLLLLLLVWRYIFAKGFDARFELRSGRGCDEREAEEVG